MHIYTYIYIYIHIYICVCVYVCISYNTGKSALSDIYAYAQCQGWMHIYHTNIITKSHNQNRQSKLRI